MIGQPISVISLCILLVLYLKNMLDTLSSGERFQVVSSSVVPTGGCSSLIFVSALSKYAMGKLSGENTSRCVRLSLTTGWYPFQRVCSSLLLPGVIIFYCYPITPTSIYCPCDWGDFNFEVNCPHRPTLYILSAWVG
jgi:hypothetical protein